MPHQFLSPEWVEAGHAIRQKYEHLAKPIEMAVRINQTITGAPFGDGTIEAHLDTTSGTLILEIGTLENPDATITTDYQTAKSILLSNDPQIAMQALLSGKIKVDGDMVKVMSIQMQVPQDEESKKLGEKIIEEIRAITE